MSNKDKLIRSIRQSLGAALRNNVTLDEVNQVIDEVLAVYYQSSGNCNNQNGM